MPSTTRKRKSPSVQFTPNLSSPSYSSSDTPPTVGEGVLHSIFSPGGRDDGMIKVLGRINTPRVKIRTKESMEVYTPGFNRGKVEVEEEEEEVVREVVVEEVVAEEEISSAVPLVETDATTTNTTNTTTTTTTNTPKSPALFPPDTVPLVETDATPNSTTTTTTTTTSNTPNPPAPPPTTSPFQSSTPPQSTSFASSLTNGDLSSQRTGRIWEAMNETMSSYSSPLSFHTPSAGVGEGGGQGKVGRRDSLSTRNANTGETMRTARSRVDSDVRKTAEGDDKSVRSVYGTPGNGIEEEDRRDRKGFRHEGVAVTLSMLNYSHILNCTSPIELEGIVEVLESKYHRRFPALLEAATKRYAEIVAGGGKKEEMEEEDEQEEEEESVFEVYEDSESEDEEVFGQEVEDVLKEIEVADLDARERRGGEESKGEGQENEPPTVPTSHITPPPADPVPVSVGEVTPKTKTLIQSYGGWTGLLPEPPTSAVAPEPQQPPSEAAKSTTDKQCGDCRVLRDKLCRTVPKAIVERMEGRIGEIKGQLQGVIQENRKLKEQDKLQASALRATSEELYSTQNQLAVVQTAIVTSSTPSDSEERVMDKETIEALKCQLEELGEIKRMRDQEANRIIQELEDELDQKEIELSDLQQSSLTQDEREGWEELVKMKGEEVEKVERKLGEIIEAKEGEIEELHKIISLKDAQLKAGETNFQKYQKRLDEVGTLHSTSSERAREEAFDLMSQLKEACEENTKLAIDEVQLKGKNEQLERELDVVREHLRQTEEEIERMGKEGSGGEGRMIVSGEGEIKEWKRKEKLYREEIKVLNKHLESQGARVSMDLYRMALEEVEEGREECRGLRVWGEKMEERVKELEGEMVKARISAPLTPAPMKVKGGASNFHSKSKPLPLKTPSSSKTPSWKPHSSTKTPPPPTTKTPSSRKAMAAKLKEKRKGLGSGAKEPLKLNTSTNIIGAGGGRGGTSSANFIKAKSPILMNAFMASKQRKLFRKGGKGIGRGLGGELDKEDVVNK